MVEDAWSVQDQDMLATSSLPGARDWSFSYDMYADTIRNFNPVPLMLHVSMEVPELKGFGQDLYTLYAELISNAVDHGLLGLDSQLKTDAEGFKQYYALRAERLQQLDGQTIRVSVRHHPEEGGGLLVIRVEDSGQGFDFRKLDLNVPKSSLYSGRGLPLVASLCERLEFFATGNIVEAHYRWRSEIHSVKLPASALR